MILSQFEEAVWHRRGSDCDVAEAWHHGGEVVSAVKAVFEFGEVAGYMLVADGTVSTSDGALDVAEGGVDPLECLRPRDQTTAPFIEKRSHRRKPLSDGIDIDHPHNIWYSNLVVNPYITLSKVDSIIYGRALSVTADVMRSWPLSNSSSPNDA